MAKLIFLEDIELEIVENYDEEDDSYESVDEVFHKGEEIDDVDIMDKHDDFFNVQFGDGSVAFGVPCAVVKITEEELEE
jgi:hypothetical protein